MRRTLLAIGFALLASSAIAQEEPVTDPYAHVPKHIRDWYRNAQLTPEAEKRFNYKSCCDIGDALDAKFKFMVDQKTGKEAWFYQQSGTAEWHIIPDFIIQHGKPHPEGKGVLFAVWGNLVCFFPPEGGI